MNLRTENLKIFCYYQDVDMNVWLFRTCQSVKKSFEVQTQIHFKTWIQPNIKITLRICSNNSMNLAQMRNQCTTIFLSKNMELQGYHFSHGSLYPFIKQKRQNDTLKMNFRHFCLVKWTGNLSKDLWSI